MERVKDNTKDRELVITRKINAPVELVWEVWTKPEHIANWWGPDGFTNTITKMEVRPGGIWELTMHGPDGTDYPNKSIFREVLPLKKIVYEHISDPHIVATITFEKQGNQTLMHWHAIFDSREKFIEVVKKYKADVGIRQNVEKMIAYLDVFQNK
ncbi:MAG TPA: SRPBCC family protein [Puia sp.]|nr:SRPBCC family protein [Puia sp.]